MCVQFKKQAKEATKGNHWEVVKPLVASLWWSSNINNAIQYWIVVNVEHDDPFSVEPHEKPKDLCWPCSWFIYGEKNTNRKNSETSRRKQKKTKTHSSILWNDHPLCFIRFGRSAVESSLFFLWKQFSYVRINKFLNIWHWNVKISFQWIVMHILQYYFWSLYIFNDTRYLIRTSFFLLIFWEISSVAQLRWIKFSFDSIFFCLTLPQITHWRERERDKKKPQTLIQLLQYIVCISLDSNFFSACIRIARCDFVQWQRKYNQWTANSMGCINSSNHHYSFSFARIQCKILPPIETAYTQLARSRTHSNR